MEINKMLGKEVKVGVALCIIENEDKDSNIIVKAKYGHYRLTVAPKDFEYWINKMNE